MYTKYERAHTGIELKPFGYRASKVARLQVLATEPGMNIEPAPFGLGEIFGEKLGKKIVHPFH